MPERREKGVMRGVDVKYFSSEAVRPFVPQRFSGVHNQEDLSFRLTSSPTYRVCRWDALSRVL